MVEGDKAESFLTGVVSGILSKIRDKYLSILGVEHQQSESSESTLESLPRELIMQAPLPLMKAIIAWRNKELQGSSVDLEWNGQLLGRKLGSECTFLSTCCQIVQECTENSLSDDIWLGLEDFVFDWLCFAERCIPIQDFPALNSVKSTLLERVARLAALIAERRRSSTSGRLAFEVELRANGRPELLADPNLSRVRKLPVLDIFGDRKRHMMRYDSSVAQAEIQNILEGMRFTGLTDMFSLSQPVIQQETQTEALLSSIENQEETPVVSVRPQRKKGRSQSLEEAILSLMVPQRDGHDSSSSSDLQKTDPPPAPPPSHAPFLSITEIQKALSTQNWGNTNAQDPVNSVKLERWASSASSLSKELNGSPPTQNEDSSKSPPSGTNQNPHEDELEGETPPRPQQSFLAQLLSGSEPPVPPVGSSGLVKTWHPGTGAYPCTICGMKFPTSQAVRGHRNAHRQLKAKTGDKVPPKKRKAESNSPKSKGIGGDGSFEQQISMSREWGDVARLSQANMIEGARSQEALLGLLTQLAVGENNKSQMGGDVGLVGGQVSNVNESLFNSLLERVWNQQTGDALGVNERLQIGQNSLALLLAGAGNSKGDSPILDLNLKLSS